jgi:large subunit ribosomal protein L30
VNPLEKTLKVTLKRSLIGTKAPHRQTVRGLGLRRLNQTVELNDTAEIRGMVTSVAYLVRVEG